MRKGPMPKQKPPNRPLKPPSKKIIRMMMSIVPSDMARSPERPPAPSKAPRGPDQIIFRAASPRSAELETSFRDGALAPDLRCAIAHRGISRFSDVQVHIIVRAARAPE